MWFKVVIWSLVLLAPLALGNSNHNAPFHPTQYRKNNVQCAAENRETNQTVNINLSFIDVNQHEKRTLLLVHGWPSLWSMWARQIIEFQDSYRLIVPELRGFGSSTHPGDVQTSGSVVDHVSDMLCLLRQLDIDSAICVGHDWGAEICYEATRERPDIFLGAAGVSIPYLPSVGNYTEVQNFLPVFPHFGYQLYFQNFTNEAIAELNEDIRRSLRATFRSVAAPGPSDFLLSTTNFLGVYGNQTVPPATFLSQEEEDYIVSEYEKQGFNFTLEFYTRLNRLGAFNFAKDQGNITITKPTLFVNPTKDPVANWTEVAVISNTSMFLSNNVNVGLPTEHWPHLEAPGAFNAILKKWLERFH